MPDAKMNVINYLQTPAGFSTARRIFDYDYFLYVHRGKGTYKIGSVTYTAVMGDLFYCPPGVGNTICADEKDPYLLSGIECLAPDYRQRLPTKISLLQHRFLTESIMEMVREYRIHRTGSGEICDALLKVMLENIVRQGSGTGQGRDPAEQLLEYLAQNYCRPITHEELSRRFHYHRNTVNRLLEAKTGLTLKNYLVVLRLRRACDLLKYTDHSIGQIAEYCGYSSTIYFSRQFHEKTGVTPGHFRATHGTVGSGKQETQSTGKNYEQIKAKTGKMSGSE